MVLDINVLGTGMGDRVPCEGNTTLVVTTDSGGRDLGVTKIFEQNAEPDGFASCVRRRHVLRLNSRECYGGLLLR